MMGQVEKKDLRVRRTHKLLFESLLSLLRERPLREISVSDICEQAMVNRTTFYHHFEDKKQLILTGSKNLLQDFYNKSFTEDHFKNTHQYCMAFFKQLLEYFLKNKESIYLYFANGNIHTAMAFLINLVVEDLTLHLESLKPKGMKDPVPIQAIANYHIGALISLLKWWIKNDMSISIEDMIEYADLLYKNEGDLF